PNSNRIWPSGHGTCSMPNSGNVPCALGGRDSMTVSNSRHATVTCRWTPGSASPCRGRYSGAGGPATTLAAHVKDELSGVKITRSSARKAEVTSIFRFSSALHLVNGSIVLEAELDTAQAAKRLRSEIKDLYGQHADIVVINAAGIRRSNRYLLR